MNTKVTTLLEGLDDTSLEAVKNYGVVLLGCQDMPITPPTAKQWAQISEEGKRLIVSLVRQAVAAPPVVLSGTAV